MQNHERQLLDDILDSALDDLDSEDQDATRSTPHQSQNFSSLSKLDSKSSTHQLMEKATTINNGDLNRKTQGTEESAAAPGGIDKAFNKLMNNMKDSTSNNHSFNIDDFGENIMAEMMKDFEAMAKKDDADSAIDGIMKQLLSKDLMYEPMKEVTAKFPQWLAENKAKLSEAEYIRYGTQYQYFQRILNLYDTEPDNISRLLELMQDIQQYGQPPAELIKELAPDLDIDRDGFPSGFDFSVPDMHEGFHANQKDLDDCKLQ